VQRALTHEGGGQDDEEGNDTGKGQFSAWGVSFLARRGL